MKLSRTGKPLCSRCWRLAVALGNYHLSNGYLMSLAYCQQHAPQDAVPLHVGFELEPILDTMLYWRIPITLEEVERRYHMLAGTALPWPITYEELQDGLAKINPARFIRRPSLEARQLGEKSKEATNMAERQNMNIHVWTKQPNRFIREACKLLKSRGHGGAECDQLLNGHFDGELVVFGDLSNAQFCTLEDMAVRMGLQYDTGQE